MAKLNENLLRSMVWDLKEVVDMSVELSSWIGKIDCMSWRYPWQQSQSVDVLSIFKNLGRCSAGEYYINLLELIYDRLALILNLLIQFLDNFPILSVNFKMGRNVMRPQHLSLGALLSMFWTRMQSLQKSILENLLVESQRTEDNVDISQVKRQDCSNSALSNISHDVVSRNCQTDSTSLTSCENCYISEELVKALITAIENASLNFKGQSAVATERKLMKEKILHVSQWSAMRSWALAIVQDFKSLVAVLEENQTKNEHLRKIIDRNDEKLDEKCKSYKKKIYDLKDQRGKLQEEIRCKEIKLSQMRDRIGEFELKMINKEKDYKILERKFQLSDTFFSECAAKEKKAESKLEELQHQLNKATQENKFLAEEIAALTSNQQQAKREAKFVENKIFEANQMVKVAEALFQEQCNEMKRVHDKEKSAILAEREAYKKDVEFQKESSLQLQAENLTLKQNVTRVSGRCQEMQERVGRLEEELKDVKRRETALLRFPDNNPSKAKMEGNPIKDMEGQLHANEIRIKLLEADNKKIAQTLDKLRRFSAKK